MENTSNNRIKKFVIVGGGTAGWFSAAILKRALINSPCQIELIESPNIPTIGVGEATIPSIIDTLRYLTIPLPEFIKATQATFKLAIKFTDWHTLGEHYWHQFGYVGGKMDDRPFYQHWLKYANHDGEHAFTDFSPSIAMAKRNKFHINNPKQHTNLSPSTYAFHFDAGLVAKYLTDFCVDLGVKHTKAEVEETALNDMGEISHLKLKNGKTVDGDFFIDCSGQSAVLIGKALQVPYINWQKYLPVDSAVAVQTQKLSTLTPYTEAIAHQHGWRWKIPLQHRTGNGYVFSSQYCDDQSAVDLLKQHINGDMLTSPRLIHFTTGKREKFWHKNCLAVGLSSGFLEPLESTSINLVLKGMLDFINQMPDKTCQQATIDEYNRLMDIEYECIRDFLVLHYCQSSRNDSAFWQSWQTREIPQSLQNKLALFRAQGRLYNNDLDLFTADSWYAVLEGMKVRPASYDPLVDTSDFTRINASLAKYIHDLDKSVDVLLSHEQFLEKISGANIKPY